MLTVGLDSFGITITWRGPLETDDLQPWIDQLEANLAGFDGRLGVLVDLSEAVVPLAPEPWLVEGIVGAQQVLAAAGMDRSAVVVHDRVHAARLQLLAHELGRLERERYLDPRRNPGWRVEAVAWITSGVEPRDQIRIDLEAARRTTHAADRLRDATLDDLLAMARQKGLIDAWVRRGARVAARAGDESWMLSVDDAERQLRSYLGQCAATGRDL